MLLWNLKESSAQRAPTCNFTEKEGEVSFERLCRSPSRQAGSNALSQAWSLCCLPHQLEPSSQPPKSDRSHPSAAQDSIKTRPRTQAGWPKDLCLILALVLTTCVTRGKPLPFPEPQSPHPSSGSNSSISLRATVEVCSPEPAGSAEKDLETSGWYLGS